MTKPAVLDTDEINKIPLDEEALGCAIEAATDAFVAGGEEREQLEAGIKAYLWATLPKPEIGA